MLVVWGAGHACPQWGSRAHANTKKEKTVPFGINLMTSQVYQAAQRHADMYVEICFWNDMSQEKLMHPVRIFMLMYVWSTLTACQEFLFVCKLLGHAYVHVDDDLQLQVVPSMPQQA